MHPSHASLALHADMHIYGHCPAQDDFYLVVCSHCGQVVKPQAFEAHCERWHSLLSKTCTRPSASTPQQQPRPRPPLQNQTSSRDRQKEGKRQGADSAPLTRPALPQRRPGKAHKGTPRYLLLKGVYIAMSWKHVRWGGVRLSDWSLANRLGPCFSFINGDNGQLGFSCHTVYCHRNSSCFFVFVGLHVF